MSERGDKELFDEHERLVKKDPCGFLVDPDGMIWVCLQEDMNKRGAPYYPTLREAIAAALETESCSGVTGGARLMAGVQKVVGELADAMDAEEAPNDE